MRPVFPLVDNVDKGNVYANTPDCLRNLVGDRRQLQIPERMDPDGKNVPVCANTPVCEKTAQCVEGDSITLTENVPVYDNTARGSLC